MIETIEIDGVKYEKRQTEERKSTRRMSNILMTTMALNGFTGGNSYSRPNPKVNIADEYQLILQKKSKLCRRDREYVQWAFKQLYKEVNE